jgi:hypothetical protein
LKESKIRYTDTADTIIGTLCEFGVTADLSLFSSAVLGKRGGQLAATSRVGFCDA